MDAEFKRDPSYRKYPCVHSHVGKRVTWPLYNYSGQNSSKWMPGNKQHSGNNKCHSGTCHFREPVCLCRIGRKCLFHAQCNRARLHMVNFTIGSRNNCFRSRYQQHYGKLERPCHRDDSQCQGTYYLERNSRNLHCSFTPGRNRNTAVCFSTIMVGPVDSLQRVNSCCNNK